MMVEEEEEEASRDLSEEEKESASESEERKEAAEEDSLSRMACMTSPEKSVEILVTSDDGEKREGAGASSYGQTFQGWTIETASSSGSFRPSTQDRKKPMSDIAGVRKPSAGVL